MTNNGIRYYPFNITSSVKDWKNGSYGGMSDHYGIMLKAGNEHEKALSLGANNSSSVSHYITVEYYTTTVSQVNLNTQNITLATGAYQSLTATVIPHDANQRVEWISNNPNVATVSNSGLIQGIAGGETTITARSVYDNSKYATCTVTVTQAVSGVNLNKSSTIVGVGKTETLIASVIPSTATNKNVIWSSSVPTVATVNNGVVTGIARGTTVITVKTVDGNYTATCNIIVYRPIYIFMPLHPSFINAFGIDSENHAEKLFDDMKIAFAGRWYINLIFVGTENMSLKSTPSNPLPANNTQDILQWLRTVYPTANPYLIASLFSFNPSNNDVIGRATKNGKHSITYVSADSNINMESYTSAIRILQHEISHNFGAIDDGPWYQDLCTTSQFCIMKLPFFFNVHDYTKIDIWCDRCSGKVYAQPCFSPDTNFPS